MSNSLDITDAKLHYEFNQALNPALSITIEGQTYDLLKVGQLPEVRNLLKDMYDKIWCEAAYDPRNAATQELADSLLPAMKKLDELVRFKK